MIKKRFAVIMIAVLIMSLPAIVNADFGDGIKLLATNGMYADSFGNSVSISGDTAIIGAKGADSAYVFVRNPDTGKWTEQKILPGAANTYFGYSVSISGDTAIVGATDADSTYVFVRTPGTGDWTEQKILVGATNSYFGSSVSISGDTAIVGAMFDDQNGRASGAAYIFVRNPDTGDWTEQKILAYDGVGGDYFGQSVSISGDTAIVGAKGDDGTYYDSGSAYIYVRTPGTDDWERLGKIFASDYAAYDQFGTSVSISGDTAIVGKKAGLGAYVFVRDPDTGYWKVQKKLLASGSSVSISGDTAIVGAKGDDSNGNDSGAADVFVRDPDTSVWTEQQKLTASVPAAYDYFGTSVSISGNTVIIGADGNDEKASGAGAAYIYTETAVTDTAPEITVTDSVAPAGDLSVPFGDVTVSTESLQTITITNNGNADLILGDIGVEDPLVDPFNWMDDCFGQTLAPGASCTFDVYFLPTTTGPFSDTFDIPSNDPNNDLLTVNVSGTGTEEVSCVPIGLDNNCDTVDDDCDGTADEDYVESEASSCGLGVCATTGTLSCVNGQETISCTAGSPTEDDTDCDGIDDDCDGTPDNNYVSESTSCGIGACASTGRKECQEGGEEVNTCTEGSPADDDTDCDGIDDDCNGTADDGYITSDTDCGLGVCASTGIRTCVNGQENNSCTAGDLTGDDSDCNGEDEDCDGTADNNYVSDDTCGVGACRTYNMPSSCDSGVETPCGEGVPLSDIDTTCDGVDDDCDGNIDDDYEGDEDDDDANDCVDNCLDIENFDQNDMDGDSIGDACDDDIDGDGMSNELEGCCDDLTESPTDSDGDGTPDYMDPSMTHFECDDGLESIVLSASDGVLEACSTVDEETYFSEEAEIPEGIEFACGFIEFTVTGLAPNATVDITLLRDEEFDGDSQYWKFDQTGYYQLENAVVNGQEITFTLTDDDGDGIVVDPGAVGVPVAGAIQPEASPSGPAHSYHGGSGGCSVAPTGGIDFGWLLLISIPAWIRFMVVRRRR